MIVVGNPKIFDLKVLSAHSNRRTKASGQFAKFEKDKDY